MNCIHFGTLVFSTTVEIKCTGLNEDSIVQNIPGGISKTVEGSNYTLDKSKVTCESCKNLINKFDGCTMIAE